MALCSSTGKLWLLVSGKLATPELEQRKYPKHSASGQTWFSNDAGSRNSSAVRFLPIDPMASSSNPPTTKLSFRMRRIIAIPGVEIARCGHIERKDLDTAR